MLNRIAFLEQSINYYDYQYWVLNDIKIPDTQYDNLVKELKELDPNNLILHKVHSSIISSNKIYLHEPLLSLDKVYSPSDLLKWCKKVSRNGDELFNLQIKYDGISSIYLKKGLLVTNGDDGYLGENISDKIPYIYFGKKLPEKNTKGELLIRKTVFKQNKEILVTKSNEKYKTPRNAVAGLINRDNIETQFKNIIEFIDYNKINYIYKLKDLENILETEAFKQWSNIIQASDYPCDGLVIKLNDLEYSKSLGFTSHHPKGDIALKFTNPVGQTVLNDIIWEIGKTGELNPVGIIEPVEISNVINSKISLHNLKYILDNDIRINDIIEVQRCGEIIPQYKKTIEKPEIRKHGIIEECPICHSKVFYKNPQLICTNLNCNGKNIKQLVDSINRIGIKELGEPTIRKLCNNLQVKTLIEVLNLTKTEIESLEGFSEISSNNLINNINEAKQNIENYKILSSFNINTIGIELSKEICKIYKVIEIFNLEINDLMKIKSISFERANYIYQYFKNNKEYILNLISLLDIKDSVNTNNPKVCFSGKMENPRSYYFDLAKQKGYSPVNTVDSTLSLLVVNDINNTSTKIEKAKKLGIKIVNVTSF